MSEAAGDDSASGRAAHYRKTNIDLLNRNGTGDLWCIFSTGWYRIPQSPEGFAQGLFLRVLLAAAQRMKKRRILQPDRFPHRDPPGNELRKKREEGDWQGKFDEQIGGRHRPASAGPASDHQAGNVVRGRDDGSPANRKSIPAKQRGAVMMQNANGAGVRSDRPR